MKKKKMQIKNMVCLVRPQDLKNIAISIFLSLFIFKIVALDINTTGVCIPDYELNASRVGSVDTTYRNTLQTLFSNLTSSSLSFYNSTAGESPNKAYALYLCRGDVSSSACRTCVKSITDPLASAIYDMCSKEGFVYADNCMLHYANYSFFGTSNNSALLMLPDKLITRNYAEYNTTRVGVLKGVITDAANSTTLFATREAGVQGDGQEKVYALAQCTRDLDKDTCSGCLNAAFDDLTNLPAGGVLKSAKAYLPSCQLRYDNVSFFFSGGNNNVSLNGASPATLNPPAVVSAFLVATWSLILIHLLLC